jgi:hypothetical protein
MTDTGEKAGTGTRPAPRGEAAWKAQKDAIAERNQKARKAGKEQRLAHERRRDEARLGAELRDVASLRGKSGSR